VINSWSEQSPEHSHLREVAEGVKAGIRMVGGMPFEINVTGVLTIYARLALQADKGAGWPVRMGDFEV
jgi:hypothetical protein